MGELAGRIRQARRRVAMSQSGLALATGVHRSAVAQWERKNGSHPTSHNLSRIAIATTTQFEWLATGRGRMGLSEPGEQEESALLLNIHAHDEVEERILHALRKLEYWQSLVIAEMVEGLSRGRNAAFGKRRA